MKIPTTLTVMDRATASRKLLPRDFMARWEENSLSAARPEKLPSGKNVWIRTLALGQTRKAAMNQVRTTPTIRTNGERSMLRTLLPVERPALLTGAPLPAAGCGRDAAGVRVVLEHVGGLDVHRRLAARFGMDPAVLLDQEPDIGAVAAHNIAAVQPVVGLGHHGSGKPDGGAAVAAGRCPATPFPPAGTSWPRGRGRSRRAGSVRRRTRRSAGNCRR